jgi:hypothetical protein
VAEKRVDFTYDDAGQYATIVPQQPISSHRFSRIRCVRLCVRSQHDQVVGQDSQSDRSLEMLKSAIEAPRQPKRPF